jgi:polyisoprenoid-binding protein YceI
MKHHYLLGALALVASLQVAAAPLKIDPAQSSVSVVFKQVSVPVEAKFRRFDALLDFDTAKISTSKAQITIDTGSLDIGEAESNKEVAKKEWFNVAQFPKATFVTSSIKENGPGKLLVSGALSIKGKTAQVSFPATTTVQGNRQIFNGILPIRRTAFGIGEGEWSDTTIVADQVTIKFQLVAVK